MPSHVYTCAGYDGCTMEVPYEMGWCHYCCQRMVYMSYYAAETPIKIDDDETMTPAAELIYAAGKAEVMKERNAISLENARLRVKLARLEAEMEELRDPGYIPAREGHLGPLRLMADAAAGAGVKGAGGRNSQACAACRAGKRSCDGDGEHACGPCAKRGVECHYPEPQKRGPKPKAR